MVDPADNVTNALPVTLPCPTRITLASNARTYDLLLAPDLFDQWTVTRSWGGKSNNLRGSKVTPVPSFEAGLALVCALTRQREQWGYERLE